MTSQLSGPIPSLCPPTLVPARAGRCTAVRTLALAGVLMWLSGCDQLGLDTPAKAAERKQAEARAIGSACRHAMRAIEDCYVLNPKADKSAVFAGWREMDEYMRENKLEGVAPVVPRPAPAASKPAAPAEDEEEPEDEGNHAASGEKGGKAASGH
jgi:hypothetical protein